MKILMDDGVGGHFEYIVPSGKRPSPHAKHDPWCTHGTCILYQMTIGGDVTQPLQTAALVSFQLKSGDVFYYLYPGFQDCWGGGLTIEEAIFFVVPGLPGTWMGEGFNYVLRPMRGMKLTTAQMAALTAASGNDPTFCVPPP